MVQKKCESGFTDSGNLEEKYIKIFFDVIFCVYNCNNLSSFFLVKNNNISMPYYNQIINITFLNHKNNYINY